MDLLAAPVRGVRELVGQPVGVPAPIVEDEIFGNRVDHCSGLRDDDELGIWVAALNLVSSSDVVVDISECVDVADDGDLWFVFEEAINEPNIWTYLSSKDSS